MSNQDPLYDLLARGATGDAAARDRAYTELTRLIKVFVRSAMGQRLRDHRESIDVCQSIAKSFVDDHGSGRIRFDNDGALVEYLRTVVRSKLAMLSRHDNAAKRAPSTDPPAPPSAPPSEQALLHGEALRQLDQQFTDLDRQVARMRLAGLEWDQIASQVGSTPEALRKRWSRLARQVSADDA